jgi:hypothetical protein
MALNNKKVVGDTAADDSEDSVSTKSTELKTCFVIMPIADMDGYDSGHWDRVYEHLIKPACLKAHRADLVAASNYIIIDILRKIVESDLVICDLSGRNPNVLYELGVRQAFNLPTALIKDEITPRIFDIQGLRCFDYKHSLRVDQVHKEQENIRGVIAETVLQTGDVNSMIQLLGVSPAPLPSRIELSSDASVILESLKDISSRLSSIEAGNLKVASEIEASDGATIRRVARKRRSMFLLNGETLREGEELYIDGKEIGTLLDVNDGGVVVLTSQGSLRKISLEVAKKINTIPF